MRQEAESSGRRRSFRHTRASARAVELARQTGHALVAVGLAVLAADGVPDLVTGEDSEDRILVGLAALTWGRAVELARRLGEALVAVRQAVLAADGVNLPGAEPVRVGFAGQQQW